MHPKVYLIGLRISTKIDATYLNQFHLNCIINVHVSIMLLRNLEHLIQKHFFHHL